MNCIFFFLLFQSSKMSSERQPLLSDAEALAKSHRLRPDYRNSPESTLVDVQSEDDSN